MLIDPFIYYVASFLCHSLMVVGLHMFPNVMRLCAAKLRMFVEHPDPNLKYLGLLALSKIMVTFPRGILEHRDLILGCLEDEVRSLESIALSCIVLILVGYDDSLARIGSRCWHGGEEEPRLHHRQAQAYALLIRLTSLPIHFKEHCLCLLFCFIPTFNTF